MLARLFAVALCFIPPLTAPSSTALAEEATSVLIAHMFSPDSFPDQAARLVADALRAEEGVGSVEVAAGARLGDERANLRQVQRGEVDITVVGTLLLNYLTPRYRLVGTPFLFRERDQVAAVYDGPIGDEIRDGLRQRGLEMLSWHCIGQRLLTANRPIASRADLQGLKLRLPPDATWFATWSALGAVPEAVAFPELHAALKGGEVEAQENPPGLIRGQRFHGVQSHLMLTRHLLQTQFVVAGRDFLQRLGPRAEARLRQAAEAASARVCARAQREQQADIDWLIGEGGMIPVELELGDEAVALLPGVARRLDGEAGVALLNRILESR